MSHNDERTTPLRVMITGAAGFLGSTLAKRLVADGHEVIGLDTLHRNEAWRLGDTKLAGYLWRNVEDVQPEDIPSHVIHCAASTDVPHTASSPRNAVNQSLHGTVAVLEACKRAMADSNAREARGVPQALSRLARVVVISSYSAYGRVPVGPSGIAEDEVLRPTTLYGAMKASQEAIGFAYWQSDGIPVTCIRLATLFGEASRATLPVALFMGKALRGEPITLTGDGTQTRDQNYVANAVDGILAALEADEAAIGQALNIGSGRELQMRELAELCIKAVRAEGIKTPTKITFLPPRFGEEGRLFLDNSRAKQAFGYEPQVSFEAGLTRTAKWFVEKYRRERDNAA